MKINGKEDEEKVFSVSEYLDLINEALYNPVSIRGEIGEKLYKYPNYTFFNLLEKEEMLPCFVFQEVIGKVGVAIEAGMEIIITGYSEVYKKTGQLKFQIRKIELVGEGMLKKQFEVLKKRLSASGYFDDKHKKPIPKFPERIGLITSAYGKGARKDFLTNLGSFGFQISFYDSKVEGVYALNEMVDAITQFNKNSPNTDVLVLTRGGGNWESLRPFNSEEIVKSIFASKIPVITGIGHENDETLADFVADFRASTPTHAAKVLVDEWEKAALFILELEKNILSLINKIFGSIKERINIFGNEFTFQIKKELDVRNSSLDNIMKNINNSFQDYFRKFEVLRREFVKNIFQIGSSITFEKKKIKDLLNFLITSNKRWIKSQNTLLINSSFLTQI